MVKKLTTRRYAGKQLHATRGKKLRHRLRVEVHWTKNGDRWWGFRELLQAPSVATESGVYIIWRNIFPLEVVKVGQGYSGTVREKLQDHSNDKTITCHEDVKFLVTWATVEARFLDSVEAYLGDRLNPRVATRFLDVMPVAVNLPEF